MQFVRVLAKEGEEHVFRGQRVIPAILHNAEPPAGSTANQPKKGIARCHNPGFVQEHAKSVQCGEVLPVDNEARNL